MRDACNAAIRRGALTSSSSTGPSVAATAVRSYLTEVSLDGTHATVSASLSGASDITLLNLHVALPFEPLFGLVPTPPTLAADLSMAHVDLP